MIARLLAAVKAGFGEPVRVLVLADRGTGTSADLWWVVEALGWQYWFRVTSQTQIVTEQGDSTMVQQVQPGQVWATRGLGFKKRGRIAAHARAVWGEGYEQAWALVTHDASLWGQEDARRHWQEPRFPDLKSGGWHGGESRMRHPDPMARLLLLLTLA
jgi:hypothetical protein